MEKNKEKGGNGEKGGNPGKNRLIAIIGIIVIVVIISGALAYGLYRNPPTSFASFKSEFNSAQRVGIVAYAYNGTQESYTIACASAIIESIVGSGTSHRNASTIDFYVINNTECVFENGVGSTIKNYTYNTTQSCVGKADAEPSIFIGYNSTNSTKVMPNSLHIYGNNESLSMCGIASELT